MEAIKQHCPKAELVLDRFHVVKALDEVGKQQWREASRPGSDLPEGSTLAPVSPLLQPLPPEHRHPQSAGERQPAHLPSLAAQRRVRAVLGVQSPVGRRALPQALDDDCAQKPSGALAHVRGQRCHKHADGILAFVNSRLTNAVAEGLNRIIRMIKNRASGFRSLNAFANMIFLCVGDLDIPAQIPCRFRTLMNSTTSHSENAINHPLKNPDIALNSLYRTYYRYNILCPFGSSVNSPDLLPAEQDSSYRRDRL